MRTLAILLAGALLLAATAHILRWLHAGAPSPTPTPTLSRRVGPSDAPQLDLASTLATHCPRLPLPGRLIVVASTLPRVALAVHPSGEQISDALVTGGEWDGWGGGYLLDIVRNGTGAASVILDAGANIGALAVRWAAAGHTVHAFEAATANADVLECSRLLNGRGVMDRLTVNRAALSDEVGQTACVSTVVQNMGMAWVTVGDGDSSSAASGCVKTTTIDHYVTTHASTFTHHFGLLKIDVEGHEPALLASAQHVLASPTLAPRAISLEVSVDRWRDRVGATAADILPLITRHGYRAVHPPAAVGGFDALVAFCEASAGGNPDIVFVKEA